MEPTQKQVSYAKEHGLEAEPAMGCYGCALGGQPGCSTAPCAETPRQPGVIFVKPAEVAGEPAGRKDDSGKLDVTLFFNDLPHAIEAVTEVMQWAITKKQPVPYERGSWQLVEDFQRRYQGAQLRHELNRAKSALAGNPEVDHETALLELAHIATDAMFRLEMALRKAKGLPVPEGA